MISPTIYTPGQLFRIKTKDGAATIWILDYLDGYVHICVVDFSELAHVWECVWVTAKAIDKSSPIIINDIQVTP